MYVYTNTRRSRIIRDRYTDVIIYVRTEPGQGGESMYSEELANKTENAREIMRVAAADRYGNAVL